MVYYETLYVIVLLLLNTYILRLLLYDDLAVVRGGGVF
jgi:hypothetical protein